MVDGRLLGVFRDCPRVMAAGLSCVRRGVLVGLLLFVVGACLSDTEFPRKPIKVVVPFSVGGGSDTFVRLLTGAIRAEGLSEQPFVVINVPGAGGTLGSRRVRQAPADGYTLLNLHDGILTAKYSGKTHFGPEAFEPVAGTGKVPLVIAVEESRPWSGLEDLMRQVDEAPDTLRFAANLGAPSHFAGLLLESLSAKTEGQFRFMQVGGGAKRFSALIGGHADVTVFSVSEYLSFRDGGVRALAVASEERLAALPELPTARELGFDLVYENIQFWWLPRGTSASRRQWIGEVLTRAMNLPEVRERLALMRVDPVVLLGEDLEETLRRKEAALAGLNEIREVSALSGFASGLLGLLVLLAGGLGWQRWRAASAQVGDAESARPFREVWGRLLIVLGYVALLGMRVIPFAWLTLVFVVGLGLVLVENSKRDWPWLVAAGVLIAWGVSFVFGEWLMIDLP